MNTTFNNPWASWLRKKVAMQSAGCFGLGVLAFVAGCMVVFLTFWFTYAVIYTGMMGVSAAAELVTGHRLHLAHKWRLVGSAVFILLVFIQHFRTDPSYWRDYLVGADVPNTAGLGYMGGVTASLGILLFSHDASARVISDLLLIGPRLVCAPLRLFRRGLQLRRMDTDGCSELLMHLSKHPAVVPYEELPIQGQEHALDQLRLLDGVVHLQKGICLSPELRTKLANLTET